MPSQPGAPRSPLGPLGPAVLAVRDRLRREISAGELAPGQRLGVEREIAHRLGVSRSTLRAALADLERSGTIVRTRGRSGGIFVAARKVERDLTSLASLPAYLRRQGFESDARVISTATVAAAEDVASELGLRPGELIHEIVRVRLADGDPISLERASFPAVMFPGLLDHALSGSLYELFEQRYGLVPAQAEERLEVVDAGSPEARLLEIARNAPLVSISRTAWNAAGTAFEVSRDLFRG
ncbi:MAG TPA: GntR family transcriptional regulator, partial [Solirubrobacteraceae bacterium]|nr:GntR family transcriptional regulator [Solirubrobacteraceae bacterium]